MSVTVLNLSIALFYSRELYLQEINQRLKQSDNGQNSDNFSKKSLLYRYLPFWGSAQHETESQLSLFCSMVKDHWMKHVG